MSKNNSTNSAFQDLLQLQDGRGTDNSIINSKAERGIKMETDTRSITKLKKRKIKVIKEDSLAKKCLFGVDGDTMYYSNIINEEKEGIKNVMQLEPHPLLPKQPLIPYSSHYRLSRSVETMTSNFGSHLPSMDTSHAVLGSRESTLLAHYNRKKALKLDKLKYTDTMDIEHQLYMYIKKNYSYNLAQMYKKQPDSEKSLEFKLEFLLEWMTAITTIKDDFDPILPTEKILFALYKQTLVLHILCCSKSNKSSKFMYTLSTATTRDMMDRLILKIPRFQGTLQVDKPFASSKTILGSVFHSAFVEPKYTLNTNDIENLHSLQQVNK